MNYQLLIESLSGYRGQEPARFQSWTVFKLLDGGHMAGEFLYTANDIYGHGDIHFSWATASYRVVQTLPGLFPRINHHLIDASTGVNVGEFRVTYSGRGIGEFLMNGNTWFVEKERRKNNFLLIGNGDLVSYSFRAARSSRPKEGLCESSSPDPFLPLAGLYLIHSFFELQSDQ